MSTTRSPPPGDLRAWLEAAYADEPAQGADLARFRGLRDALRRLAAQLTGDDRPTGASARPTSTAPSPRSTRAPRSRSAGLNSPSGKAGYSAR